MQQEADKQLKHLAAPVHPMLNDPSIPDDLVHQKPIKPLAMTKVQFMNEYKNEMVTKRRY